MRSRRLLTALALMGALLFLALITSLHPPATAAGNDGEASSDAERNTQALAQGAAIGIRIEAEQEQRLEGELWVDGRRVESVLMVLDAQPDEVIASYRSRFEALPVDLWEASKGGTQVLTVLDIHGGRQIVLTARPRAGGGTELLQGTTVLREGLRDEPLPSFLALPRELHPLSLIEDRTTGLAVWSLVLVGEDACASTERALEASLRANGWEGPGAPPKAGLELRHRAEGAQLLARCSEGPGNTSWVVLRMEKAP